VGGRTLMIVLVMNIVLFLASSTFEESGSSLSDGTPSIFEAWGYNFSGGNVEINDTGTTWGVMSRNESTSLIQSIPLIGDVYSYMNLIINFIKFLANFLFAPYNLARQFSLPLPFQLFLGVLFPIAYIIGIANFIRGSVL